MDGSKCEALKRLQPTPLKSWKTDDIHPKPALCWSKKLESHPYTHALTVSQFEFTVHSVSFCRDDIVPLTIWALWGFHFLVVSSYEAQNDHRKLLSRKKFW
jgi:hypothetical protein